MSIPSVKDLPPDLKRLMGIGNTRADLKHQLTSSSQSSTATPQGPSLVVGFENEDQNCWCNSLLQMVIHIPSLNTAYKTFARHHCTPRSPIDARHATTLLWALDFYHSCLQRQIAVPFSVSQNVRVALHHFFPSISPFSHHAEDAHEALLLLMGGYERAQQQNLSSLYTPITTTRTYESMGFPRAADPARLALTLTNPDHPNVYVRLIDGITSQQNDAEYQIFLDLQNHEHLKFQDLFLRCFHIENPEADPAVYLRADNQIQDFRLKQVNWQFGSVPEELVLTVKRFGSDPLTGEKFKITSPLDIPKTLQLPDQAVAQAVFPARQPIYDLSVFVLHRGNFNSGHYITYLKVQGTWVECSDSILTERSEWEIERILRNPAGSNETSYIHYYKLRPENLQAERFAVREGMAPMPPAAASSSHTNTPAITETTLPRKMAAELRKIGDLLKWCGGDDPTIERVRLWHKESQRLLKPRDEDLPYLREQLTRVCNEVSPQLCAQLIKLCSEDLAQLRLNLIATMLELALKDPINPQIPFSPHLFERGAKPIIQQLIAKMTNHKSVFFSERIRCALELKEIGDYLTTCNPDDPIVKRVALWHKQFTRLVGFIHLNPSQFHNSLINTLENILKDPRNPDNPFSSGLFVPQTEPIFQFLISKMKNKDSVFFSKNLEEAFQRHTLQQSIDRIKIVERKHFNQNAEVEEELQATVDELNQQNAEYYARLAATHNQFLAATAPMQEGAKQLKQEIPVLEKEVGDQLEELKPGIAELKEGNVELAKGIQISQEAAQRVESEQAQLATAQAELDKAIKKANDAWLGNAFLTGLLIGGSMLLTWGMSSLVAGASINIAKVAGGTMISVGLATVDPGKGRGPRRGPPPPRGSAR